MVANGTTTHPGEFGRGGVSRTVQTPHKLQTVPPGGLESQGNSPVMGWTLVSGKRTSVVRNGKTEGARRPRCRRRAERGDSVEMGTSNAVSAFEGRSCGA